MRRDDVATLIGIKARHFDDAIKPLLSAEHIRGRAKTLRYYAPGVVEARLGQQVSEAARPKSDDDALVFAGGNSDNLEELRKWKAKQAKRDYLISQKELIPAPDLDPGMSQLMSVLRRATETIQRRFGNDASQIIEDAVKEVRSRWQRLVPSPSKELEDEAGVD